MIVKFSNQCVSFDNYESSWFLLRLLLKRGRFNHFKIMAFDYESQLGASDSLSIAITTDI